jgi:hypothetical protein
MSLSKDGTVRLRNAMRSTRAAQEVIDRLGAVGLTGDVFYYDPTSGSDDNDGTRSDQAKATMNAAIGLCTANNGDVIVSMRGGEEVTETVAFDVAGITVIPQTYGQNPYSFGEMNSIYSASTFTDGPAATITAACSIYGMAFVSRDTGATFYDGAACLIGGLATALPFGVHLSHCRFPKWGLDNRTGLAIEGGSNILIEHCEFEGVTQDFGQGIYLQGASANIEICWNRFTDCDYAIELGAFAGGGPHLDFHHNTVLGADSKGVNTQANTGVGIIRNNWFNTAAGNTTFDRTVAQVETQGFICTANHYAAETVGEART